MAEMEVQLREKERLASLGLLAAGVAHEVNTPLTGISSYTQFLLADIEASHPHHEILKKLERQTFRAAQIVQNLLEFSRNRSELAPVNLAAAVDEAVRNLEERARDAAVTVEWQPPGETLRVLGQEGELVQVFSNLTANAVEAMAPRGGGTLRLRVERREDRLLAHISDTGPGIPPERQERIFQPFFSGKLGQGGTGLGLAITSNIVRRHRGRIRISNHADGPGCTFTVDLPDHPF
jgi:signal transduction histidine kinase